MGDINSVKKVLIYMNTLKSTKDTKNAIFFQENDDFFQTCHMLAKIKLVDYVQKNQG